MLSIINLKKVCVPFSKLHAAFLVQLQLYPSKNSDFRFFFHFFSGKINVFFCLHTERDIVRYRVHNYLKSFQHCTCDVYIYTQFFIYYHRFTVFVNLQRLQHFDSADIQCIVLLLPRFQALMKSGRLSRRPAIKTSCSNSSSRVKVYTSLSK